MLSISNGLLLGYLHSVVIELPIARLLNKALGPHDTCCYLKLALLSCSELLDLSSLKLSTWERFRQI